MVEWKICQNCNKKVNITAEKCPYCNSYNFKKYDPGNETINYGNAYVICPECGEKNPHGSKYCRTCGINLIHEHKTTTQKTAKKATVETHHRPKSHTTTQHKTQNTTKKNKDDNGGLIACCICLFFLFLIFAIASV